MNFTIFSLPINKYIYIYIWWWWWCTENQ